MGTSLKLRTGEAGTVVAYDGALLTIQSPIPIAPGTPLGLTLQLDTPLPLEAKSIGSTRQDDGSFLVRMRLVTVTRQARSTLETLKSPQ